MYFNYLIVYNILQYLINNCYELNNNINSNSNNIFNIIVCLCKHNTMKYLNSTLPPKLAY